MPTTRIEAARTASQRRGCPPRGAEHESGLATSCRLALGLLLSGLGTIKVLTAMPAAYAWPAWTYTSFGLLECMLGSALLLDLGTRLVIWAVLGMAAAWCIHALTGPANCGCLGRFSGWATRDVRLLLSGTCAMLAGLANRRSREGART